MDTKAFYAKFYHKSLVKVYVRNELNLDFFVPLQSF